MNNPSTAPEEPLARHTDCDVAIVGYGPVGMIAAGLLAQRGLNVVVVERWPARYSLSRAGHLDSETMRTFQKLGVAEDIELIARPMLEWSLMSADMEVLATVMLGQGRLRLEGELPLLSAGDRGGLRRQGPPVGRPGAHGNRGHRHRTGCRLRHLDGRSQLRPGRPAAFPVREPHTIRASYVIGADGARSWVRVAVGADRSDLGFPALDQLVIDFEPFDPDVAPAAAARGVPGARPRPAAAGRALVRAAALTIRVRGERRREPRGARRRAAVLGVPLALGHHPRDGHDRAALGLHLREHARDAVAARAGCSSPATPRTPCHRSWAKACAPGSAMR